MESGAPGGWCPELLVAGVDESTEQPSARDHLRMCEVYSQRLMVYDAQCSNLPHAGGRLFQQYVVDAVAKVEGRCLDWVRKNQDRLRVE